MENLVFEYYTRKPEFLSPGKTFEAVYLPPGDKPKGFVRDEWEFRGRASPPKSATVEEVRKGPIYRYTPDGVDPKVLWPNL